MFDFIGLVVMLSVMGFVTSFITYQNLYYKGRRRKHTKPDLLEAALLKKQIANNELVVDVPTILVVGK